MAPSLEFNQISIFLEDQFFDSISDFLNLKIHSTI